MNTVTTIQGLSDSEAAIRRQEYGANKLPAPRPPGVLPIFLRQFRSPFIYVLLVAAVLSFVLGQQLNAIVILCVLAINSTIGTIQEFAAERAADALRNLVPSKARVLRDGRFEELDSSLLVPGDIIALESGDRVPADVRLQTCANLKVDESMLTGESQSVHKESAGDAEGGSSPEHSVFAGTMVTRGRATGCVIATGPRTEIGQIAQDVTAADRVKPPLVARMERFTILVSVVMTIVIAVIFLVSLSRGDELATIFLLGVALMVSAIPEGLPAAITVALAIGMRRMARVNVIIRKLAAVESLGSCTYIASDKTGTLTVNELTIQQIVLPGDCDLEVNGDHISSVGGGPESLSETQEHAARALAYSGALTNEATLNRDGSGFQGDMVDVCFLVLAKKLGMEIDQLREKYPEVGSIPYESENCFSAAFNRSENGILISVKGAFETVIPMCTRVSSQAKLDSGQWTRVAENLAAKGYRVVAVASGVAGPDLHPQAAMLHDLEFLGMAGIMDPVRPDATEALRKCREARITAAMVTGDHPNTAIFIARQLGLVDEQERGITGNELLAAEAAGEGALDRAVLSHKVFARVTPAQKKLIVDRLIRNGHYVAVTGDGVNDAPALHHAHVGVAMGKRGTDVARESADLILTDDRFASIVNGVREGRIVYNNIRKVIFLLISTGAAEITLFLWSIVLHLPLPLLPLQLLWLNLVTNGVQDVALAFEPAEGDELKRAPRDPQQPIFDRLMVERVVISALHMGTLAFAVFYFAIETGMAEEAARNVTLLLMVLFENVHALNSRSEDRSLLRVPFFSNPLLLFGILIAQCIHIGCMFLPAFQNVLQMQPVSLALWAQLLVIASSLLIVDEAHKYLKRRKAAWVSAEDVRDRFGHE